jgi:sigma-E factor negative regulatory protein RseC
VYLFPVICLLIGGLSGNAIATRFSMDASLLSVSAALLCLAAALFFVRFKGSKLAVKNAYRPRIIRVIGRGSYATDGPEPPQSCKPVTAEHNG